MSNQVGEGLELQAIAACVLGGTELLGGRGTVVGAVSGALSLFALFTLLNLLGMPEPLGCRARRHPDRRGRAADGAAHITIIIGGGDG